MVRENRVVIKKVNNIFDRKSIKERFDELLEDLGEGILIRPNGTVMIKVNVCLLKGYETGATVDPFLVKCLVDWLLDNFQPKQIIVSESDATHLDADIAFTVLGWREILKGYPRVRIINLSKDEMVKVKLNGRYFHSLWMSKTYMECDYLISFAKLKTHFGLGQKITCVLKNQFGANPEKVKIIHHPHLAEAIYELNKVRTPDLCFIDGIIAMEGEGPTDGSCKPLGLLIGGIDAVSVDHACAKLMGFRPCRIPHLRLAMKNGLGSKDYELVAPDLKGINTKFRFTPAWKRALQKAVVKVRGIRKGWRE